MVSEKGWIRALKGQIADLSSVSFKGDDAWKTSFFAETTSKILVLASDGKVFTLDAAKLPGGRGQGEPIRLMADLDESAAIVAVWLTRRAQAADRRVFDGQRLRCRPRTTFISSTRKGLRGAQCRRSRRRGAGRSGGGRPCRRDRPEPKLLVFR